MHVIKKSISMQIIRLLSSVLAGKAMYFTSLLIMRKRKRKVSRAKNSQSSRKGIFEVGKKFSFNPLFLQEFLNKKILKKSYPKFHTYSVIHSDAPVRSLKKAKSHESKKSNQARNCQIFVNFFEDGVQILRFLKPVR